MPWPLLVWILESGNGLAFHYLFSLNKKAVVSFLLKLASFCLTPEVCSCIRGSLGQYKVSLENASDYYMSLYVFGESGSLRCF